MYSLRLLQQQRSRDIIHNILLAMKYICNIYVLEPSYMCSIIRVIYCDVLNGLRYCAIGSLWIHSFLNLNILTIQCGSRSTIWIYYYNYTQDNCISRYGSTYKISLKESIFWIMFISFRSILLISSISSKKGHPSGFALLLIIGHSHRICFITSLKWISISPQNLQSLTSTDALSILSYSKQWPVIAPNYHVIFPKYYLVFPFGSITMTYGQSKDTIAVILSICDQSTDSN